MIELFLRSLKASNSYLAIFPLYCPFKGGYFRLVDLKMGVHVRLREVFAYGRFKNVYF